MPIKTIFDKANGDDIESQLLMDRIKITGPHKSDILYISLYRLCSILGLDNEFMKCLMTIKEISSTREIKCNNEDEYIGTITLIKLLHIELSYEEISDIKIKNRYIPYGFTISEIRNALLISFKYNMQYQLNRILHLVSDIDKISNIMKGISYDISNFTYIDILICTPYIKDTILFSDISSRICCLLVNENIDNKCKLDIIKRERFNDLYVKAFINECQTIYNIEFDKNIIDYINNLNNDMSLLD